MKKNKSSVPYFLFAPWLPSHEGIKMIFSPKYQLYWQVMEFNNQVEQSEWVINNEEYFKNKGAYSVNFHKKYPYVIICVGVEKETTEEELIKIGNRASDWYAEHFFKRKRDFSTKNKSYEHFFLATNYQNHEGMEAIIKMSEPKCFVFYKVSDSYFVDYEQFYSKIAEVNWIGEKPTDEEKEQILIDCWNFLRIEEKLMHDE